MYNQKVTYDTDHWEYSPLKYWPNDIATGNVDDGDGASPSATGSEAGGKVSFFAYAPYVFVTTNSSNGTLGKEKAPSATVAYETEVNQKGSVGTGITNITANNVTGDPVITYVLNTTTPSQNVDLLWGTAGTSSAAASYNNVVGTTISAANTATKNVNGAYYQVWKNCTKQKSNQNISLNFVHALAKIGNITLAMDPNNGITADKGGTGSFGNTASVGYTNVTVQNITLSYAGSASETFNLHTGDWSKTGSSTISYVLDSNTELNTDIFYDNGSEPGSFNSLPSGVTGIKASSTTTPALNSSTTPMLYFFPTVTTSTTPFILNISITYTLRTYDPNLSQGWTLVTQTISKVITFTDGLRVNGNYTLNLLLGVEDINISATVQSWDDGSSTDVYLPIDVM